MGLYVQIVLLLSAFVYSGCSSAQLSTHEKNKGKIKKVTPFDDMATGSSELKKLKEKSFKSHSSSVPDLVLPPAYEDVSVLNSKKITFSAQNANFSTVLHAISNIAGLNLIIDQEINTNKPITISVHEADIENVLDILMKMTGCYYQLNGNIL
ncbi:MAG TPA: hypothetical protein ENK66_03890, partial [Arcobacter sp.]|nr:hypothetical protein [Arcobacter sp.]